MKFGLSIVALWLVFLVGAMAYSISEGTFSVNEKELFLIDDLSLDEVNRAILNSNKDTISIEVKLGGSVEKRPHELLFLFSNNDGLDYPVFPEYNVNTQEAKVTLLINKIPASLKAQERIFVSVIAADDNAEEPNLFTQIVELVPSQELQSSFAYKKPVRLGAASEIHHEFREEASTVNPIVPIFFSAIAGVLLLALFGSWVSILGNSLFAASQGSTFKTAFLATIASVEFAFIKYYLGATIFTTIFYVFLLAGPFLFFGSRALSTLAKQRLAGKA